MLKAQIRQIDCPDVADISNWIPGEAEDLFLGIDIKIGIEDEAGADDFQLLVASPKAVEKNKSHYDESYFRRALIMEEFCWNTVTKYIHDCVDSCEGSNWEDISKKLSKYFHWEYEDYSQE